MSNTSSFCFLSLHWPHWNAENVGIENCPSGLAVRGRIDKPKVESTVDALFKRVHGVGWTPLLSLGFVNGAAELDRMIILVEICIWIWTI